MIVLVRHAMPTVDRAIAPAGWQLSPQGLAAARDLASSLPAGAHLVSSAEPKAQQTLEPAGPVVTDARFNEIERTGEPFDGDFRSLRLSYVEGTDHAGWESRSQAAARFDAALAAHQAHAAGRPLVVASHGMVMTVWLTARLGLADPGRFWAELRLPDRIGVDLDSREVRRL